MIRAALQALGDAPFLHLADGTAETAASTLAQIEAHAERLRDARVERGDVVALHGLPPADLVRMMLATMAEGMVAWPLSDRDPPRVLAQQLAASGARAIVSGAVDSIATRDDGDPRWRLPAMATLVRTSGSSGEPKLTAHRLDSHIASAHAAVEATGFAKGDRWLLSLPLFHVGGVAIVCRALVGGGSIAIPPAAARTESALTVMRPTHISVVATQLLRILRSEPALRAAAECRCVLVGGGPVPAGLRARALDAGVPLAVCYGSTETAAFIAATREPDVVRLAGSAGRPLAGRSVELSDAGEILVGGPTVLAGYVEGAELVDVTDDEGRYATGDLGRFEDGVLFVTGRRDRLFITGGENVQPEEIEMALETHPEVEQAVVVAVPHPEFGSRPAAFVHLVEDSTVGGDALEKHLRGSLAGFKVPDAIYELPGSETLTPKPNLRQLCAMAADPDRHLLRQL